LDYLVSSIFFLLNKGIVENRINIMPVIGEKWNTNEFNKLKDSVVQIKKLYQSLNITPNIFINECIDKKHSNILSLSDNCSCGCGSRVVCVDYTGKIYSCFIAAGLSKENRKFFLIGDIKNNLKSLSHNKNRYLSCPVWTTIYAKSAINSYKKIYQIWGTGLLYII